MSDVILFDLDGTLTDSGPGITKCVQYALNYMGKPEKDLDKLKCFVGPPLHEQFMAYCGFTSEEADTAVEQYRERYATIGIYENSVYDRIPEVLALLKEQDKILAVASSKPTIFVEEILSYFHLREFFTAVVGSEMDGRRTAKNEVIEETLKVLGYENSRERVLMVGDREHDVNGAKKCGIQCVGVAYGYGGREELEKAGAAYIADTVEDLGILAEADDEGDEKVSRFQTRRQKRKQAREERVSKKRKEAAAAQGTGETAGKRNTISMKKEPLTPKNLGHMLWDIFAPILFHYVCLIGVTCIGILLAGVLILGQGTDYFAVVGKLPWISSVITGVTSLIVIFFLGRIYLRDKEKLGMRIHNWNWVTAVICGVTSIGLGQLINRVLAMTELQKIFGRYTEVAENTFENQNLLVLVMCIGVLGSLAEEIVFRGLVFTRTRVYLGTAWAVGLSAAAFGVYHGNVMQFIYALLMGVFFALIFEKTGNLLAPVIAHIAVNVWGIFSDKIFDYAVGVHAYGEWILLAVMAVCAVGGIWYLFLRKVDMTDEQAEVDDKSVESIETEKSETEKSEIEKSATEESETEENKPEAGKTAMEESEAEVPEAGVPEPEALQAELTEGGESAVESVADVSETEEAEESASEEASTDIFENEETEGVESEAKAIVSETEETEGEESEAKAIISETKEAEDVVPEEKTIIPETEEEK